MYPSHNAHDGGDGEQYKGPAVYPSLRDHEQSETTIDPSLLSLSPPSESIRSRQQPRNIALRDMIPQDTSLGSFAPYPETTSYQYYSGTGVEQPGWYDPAMLNPNTVSAPEPVDFHPCEMESRPDQAQALAQSSIDPPSFHSTALGSYASAPYAIPYQNDHVRGGTNSLYDHYELPSTTNAFQPFNYRGPSGGTSELDWPSPPNTAAFADGLAPGQRFVQTETVPTGPANFTIHPSPYGEPPVSQTPGLEDFASLPQSDVDCQRIPSTSSSYHSQVIDSSTKRKGGARRGIPVSCVPCKASTEMTSTCNAKAKGQRPCNNCTAHGVPADLCHFKTKKPARYQLKGKRKHVQCD